MLLPEEFQPLKFLPQVRFILGPALPCPKFLVIVVVIVVPVVVIGVVVVVFVVYTGSSG